MAKAATRSTELDTSKLMVRREQCKTCIYKGDRQLLKQYEDDCRRKHGVGFYTYRSCHSTRWEKADVCCRGFYDKRGDEVLIIRLAEIIGKIVFVNAKGEVDA